MPWCSSIKTTSRETIDTKSGRRISFIDSEFASSLWGGRKTTPISSQSEKNSQATYSGKRGLIKVTALIALIAVALIGGGLLAMHMNGGIMHSLTQASHWISQDAIPFLQNTHVNLKFFQPSVLQLLGYGSATLVGLTALGLIGRRIHTFRQDKKQYGCWKKFS